MTTTRVLLSIVALAAAAALRGQDGVDAIWRDPVFQKQFVAGYGFDADIEPRVTKDEVNILEKVRPLMADGKLEEAAVELQERISPKCSAILDYTLAGIRFQQERLADALTGFKTAVDKFPSFRRAWRNLGFVSSRLGDHGGTIRAFTRMIELGGADAYSFGALAFAHWAKQDYQPSEAAFRSALLLQPENAQWRIGLTQCVLKERKFEDAAALLDVLIAREPQRPEFWMLQAFAFLGMKEQQLRAAENLEIVDHLGKATVDSSFTLGDIYLGESLPERAAAVYARAIDIDPKAAVARAIRAAEVLSARGAPEQAQAVLEHLQGAAGSALSDNDKRRALKLKARIRLAAGDDSAEDAATLEEIVKLDPLDGDALLMLGRHYQKNGEPDRAMLCFERAGSVEAFEAEAKIRHAQVLVSLNRCSEALPLLRRAQQIRPREDVARYIDQVDRVARLQK
jgi:tetratricopeptide (TPR) repeat protein